MNRRNLLKMLPLVPAAVVALNNHTQTRDDLSSGWPIDDAWAQRAAIVFKVPLHEVTPRMREQVKIAYHLMAYGI